MKQLATKISEKRGKPYADNISYIRTKIGFALLRSSVLCLRGCRALKPRVVIEISISAVVEEGRQHQLFGCLTLSLCLFLDILFFILILPCEFPMFALYIYIYIYIYIYTYIKIFITYIEVLSSPLVGYFCDWAAFTLVGGEQLGVQHAAKCYSSSLCSDLHPSLLDGIHGPFYILFFREKDYISSEYDSSRRSKLKKVCRCFNSLKFLECSLNLT